MRTLKKHNTTFKSLFTKMKNLVLLSLLFFCSTLSSVKCLKENQFDLLKRLIQSYRRKSDYYSNFVANIAKNEEDSVFLGPQEGLKEADKIESLPGQPDGVSFRQYSGYVTVNPEAGRALFYYFAESDTNADTKPLVLWLNGGPGCSSIGFGAFMELGPFRVNNDNQTLSLNEYAWNKEANVLFLESPVGVGFSYSNQTSDQEPIGDNQTAEESYAFLANWLERFPEYKTRDFYITGENYAGHYVPQLAQKILHYNKNSKHTVINLRGVAIGNAYIDDDALSKGTIDFVWSHALISNEIHKGILLDCNSSSPDNLPYSCLDFLDQAMECLAGVNSHNIYAPHCSSKNHMINGFDECSRHYIKTYLNTPEVQRALHANATGISKPWINCKNIFLKWTDQPETVLPLYEELMASGVRVWLYSGDTDGGVSVTSTQYSIDKLKPLVETPWYPWSCNEEVAGYVSGYKNLTFVTVKGAGQFVPSYKPAEALLLFLSFLKGELPKAFL